MLRDAKSWCGAKGCDGACATEILGICNKTNAGANQKALDEAQQVLREGERARELESKRATEQESNRAREQESKRAREQESKRAKERERENTSERAREQDSERER